MSSLSFFLSFLFCWFLHHLITWRVRGPCSNEASYHCIGCCGTGMKESKNIFFFCDIWSREKVNGFTLNRNAFDSILMMNTHNDTLAFKQHDHLYSMSRFSTCCFVNMSMQWGCVGSDNTPAACVRVQDKAVHISYTKRVFILKT